MGKKVEVDTPNEVTSTEGEMSQQQDNNKLLYRIDNDPPWLLAVLLGFQVNLLSYLGHRIVAKFCPSPPPSLLYRKNHQRYKERHDNKSKDKDKKIKYLQIRP